MKYTGFLIHKCYSVLSCGDVGQNARLVTDTRCSVQEHSGISTSKTCNSSNRHQKPLLEAWNRDTGCSIRHTTRLHIVLWLMGSRHSLFVYQRCWGDLVMYQVCGRPGGFSARDVFQRFGRFWCCHGTWEA